MEVKFVSFSHSVVDKAVQFIQAEKLYYETALIMDLNNQEITVEDDQGYIVLT